MTEKNMDEIFASLVEHEKAIMVHNEQFLRCFGEVAKKDFADLMEFCDVTGKIAFVDEPKGHDNKEDFGIFKNVHVEQWSTTVEGDSYAGYVYANVDGRWIKIPFSC